MKKKITLDIVPSTHEMEPSTLDKKINSPRAGRSLQLTIYKYKHSTNGRPFVTDIFQESCCPVKAVLAFISVRGTTSGPLFCWPGGAPIKRSIFVEQLNRALRFCNLDPTLYKAHSFCIGAATLAAARGLSEAQIRQLGRWKSKAF